MSVRAARFLPSLPAQAGGEGDSDPELYAAGADALALAGQIHAVMTTKSLAAIRTHADWVMIDLLLRRRQHGMARPDLVAAAQCAAGTADAIFKRFAQAGYIACGNKVGRTEIYWPTEKFAALVSVFAPFALPAADAAKRR